MPSSYLHPRSEKRIESLVTALPHALLITGPHGLGLDVAVGTIQSTLLAQLVPVLPEKDDVVNEQEGIISIDIVRRLYEQTRTVLPGKRLVVIHQADSMGVAAQNAFLKLLEEPSESTHFILLSHRPQALLPTIRSRTQHIELQPITIEQTENLLDDLGVTDATRRQQLLFIASGLPEELGRLVQEEAYFTKRAEAIKQARAFLAGSPYERMRVIHAIGNDRPQALSLLQDAALLLQRSILDGKSPEKIHTIDNILEAMERIEGNGNVKLQLAKVVIE